MARKRLLAGLAVLILIVGCAKVKMEGEKEITETDVISIETIDSDNEKYKDKLSLGKDGIDFAHTFDCPGAYFNQMKDRAFDPDDRLISYTQVVKCSITGETHTLKYYETTHNELGQKDSYKLDMSCSKTGENYQMTVKDIGYDYSWGILTYKVEIDGDTLVFPEPK